MRVFGTRHCASQLYYQGNNLLPRLIKGPLPPIHFPSTSLFLKPPPPPIAWPACPTLVQHTCLLYQVHMVHELVCWSIVTCEICMQVADACGNFGLIALSSIRGELGCKVYNVAFYKQIRAVHSYYVLGQLVSREGEHIIKDGKKKEIIMTRFRLYSSNASGFVKPRHGTRPYMSQNRHRLGAVWPISATRLVTSKPVTGKRFELGVGGRAGGNKDLKGFLLQGQPQSIGKIAIKKRREEKKNKNKGSLDGRQGLVGLNSGGGFLLNLYLG